MVEGFPSASFGKPPGAGAYQILGQDEAFAAPEIARAFQTICSRFEWKPTRGELVHSPCFAILPTDGAVLIAKYTDAGRDAAGRPHTLRVECLLADLETFARACSTLDQDQAADWEMPDCFQVIGDHGCFSTN
jgi:hypothetical protein